MARELRIQILVYLERERRSGVDEYVVDSRIAEATSSTVREVQRQLDILEGQGLIESANGFGEYSAMISPAGSLALEGAFERESRNRTRIGF